MGVDTSLTSIHSVSKQKNTTILISKKCHKTRFQQYINKAKK